MNQTHALPGVQRDMVYLRETKGDMLCLYAPSSRTLRSYCAVLEVSPINFSLKAEEEQEAIIERFAALIRSLSFPLQVLVRISARISPPTSGACWCSPMGRCSDLLPGTGLPVAWLTSYKRSPPNARSSNGMSMSLFQPQLVLATLQDGKDSHHFSPNQRRSVRLSRGASETGTGPACRSARATIDIVQPHLPPLAERRASSTFL
jgi:hypothetical protein